MPPEIRTLKLKIDAAAQAFERDRKALSDLPPDMRDDCAKQIAARLRQEAARLVAAVREMSEGRK